MRGFSNIAISELVFVAAAERVQQRCRELAKCSESSQHLTRTFCSNAMAAAHQVVADWMRSANLATELDSVGNLIGEKIDRDDRPCLMIGSHLDTVVNAGRYDGTLGVLLGVAVVEVLDEMNIELPFDIQVVGFSEEEGVRFRYPFIGSLGITGEFPAEALQRKDGSGETLGEALAKFGCAKEISSASYTDRNILGFIEPHIEQATRLQEQDNGVGTVTAIAGQTRATIRVQGEAGHAGTVPHDQRKDALAAAADMILAIEKIGQEMAGLYATVGTIEAIPSLSNVICGQANLRLDLRHELDSAREQAYDEIEQRLSEIARERAVTCNFADVQRSEAIPMNAELCELVAEAVAECTGSDIRMVSGAGHDAMIMSKLTRSCMLFVRCRDGISHHPDEFVETDDIRTALHVLVRTMLRIADTV